MLTRPALGSAEQWVCGTPSPGSEARPLTLEVSFGLLGVTGTSHLPVPQPSSHVCITSVFGRLSTLPLCINFWRDPEVSD